MIEIRGLGKSYGETVIIERISLDITDGAFCTVVGPSGCGKSTFLRLLLGQEQPSTGSITIGGGRLPPEPGPDRGIVFQRYSVFPHLSVLENLLLGGEFKASPVLGRLFGTQRRALAATALELLDHIGLAEAADRYPAQLSGGMQQRLALGQALLCEPKILLLDEPFGALDPGVRLDMHELLLALWQQRGMTVFMVTHDLPEAFKLGTRLLVFDRSRRDPHAPEAYGATITYDLPLKGDGLGEVPLATIQSGFRAVS